MRCLLEHADRPLQCTISVSAPCNDEYTLYITILGKDGGVFRSHEVPMHCGQTLYDASFVVANRHILVNRCDHPRAAFTARKFDVLGLIVRIFVQPIFVPNNASPSRPPLIYSRHVPRPYRCPPACFPHGIDSRSCRLLIPACCFPNFIRCACVLFPPGSITRLCGTPCARSPLPLSHPKR